MTDPVSALNQTELDRLETYVGASSTPWWYHPAVGLASGLAVSTGGFPIRWLGVIVAIAAAACIGALYGWWARRAGAIPVLRNMPAPLLRVLVGYWAVFAVVMGAMLTWAILSQADWAYAWAGTVQLVVAGLGGRITDHIYQRRARALAQEAGIDRG